MSEAGQSRGRGRGRSRSSSAPRTGSKKRKADTTASACKSVREAGQIFKMNTSNVARLHERAVPTWLLPACYGNYTIHSKGVQELGKDLNKDVMTTGPETERRMEKVLFRAIDCVAAEFHVGTRLQHLLSWDDSESKRHTARPDYIILKELNDDVNDDEVKDDVLAVIVEAKPDSIDEEDFGQVVYQMGLVFNKRGRSVPVVGILSTGILYYFFLVDTDSRVYCSGAPVHLHAGLTEGCVDYAAEGSTTPVLYGWLRMAIEVMLASSPPASPAGGSTKYLQTVIPTVEACLRSVKRPRVHIPEDMPPQVPLPLPQMLTGQSGQMPEIATSTPAS